MKISKLSLTKVKPLTLGLIFLMSQAVPALFAEPAPTSGEPSAQLLQPTKSATPPAPTPSPANPPSKNETSGNPKFIDRSGTPIDNALSHSTPGAGAVTGGAATAPEDDVKAPEEIVSALINALDDVVSGILIPSNDGPPKKIMTALGRSPINFWNRKHPKPVMH